MAGVPILTPEVLNGERVSNGTIFLLRAPRGHWGAVSPDPLRRFAPNLIFNPQPLRDSPKGVLGSGLPGPLASLRSESCDV